MAMKDHGASSETDAAEELNLALARRRAKPKSMPTAADRRRHKALAEYLDWYESTFGTIPQAELDEVDRLWPA